MRSNANRNLAITLVAVLAVSLAVPVFAQDTNPPQTQGQEQTKPATTGAQDQPTTTESQSQQTRSATTAASGQKMEIEGVILKRTGDNFTLLDERGKEVVVTLTNDTEVKERKSNPFRRAKNYATTQLLRGLQVKVEGRGDGSGSIVADEVKFKDDDLRVANSVESRVTPVEGRLDQAENRLGQSEQNAQRLSGQVEELTSISNAARGGAKAAQETADQAVEAANQAAQSANQANAGVKTTNERISSLDDFDVKNSMTVNFRVGSSVLSKDAKATLDQIAEEAKTEKGFVLEITGFASADGSEDFNRRLSQRRADAVIRYLAENHEIPLRRLITPFGYGEKQPVADNSTRDGRQQNRRVEVKILVNKGLVQSASTEQPAQSPENR
jgi:outer membrane protein OmpA-like peptidoglycan-associated protein